MMSLSSVGLFFFIDESSAKLQKMPYKSDVKNKITVAPEYVFSQKCYLDCSTRAIEKKFLLLFSDRLLSDQENSKLMLVSYAETKTKS